MHYGYGTLKVHLNYDTFYSHFGIFLNYLVAAWVSYALLIVSEAYISGEMSDIYFIMAYKSTIILSKLYQSDAGSLFGCHGDHDMYITWNVSLSALCILYTFYMFLLVYKLDIYLSTLLSHFNILEVDSNTLYFHIP